MSQFAPKARAAFGALLSIAPPVEKPCTVKLAHMRNILANRSDRDMLAKDFAHVGADMSRAIGEFHAGQV